MNQQKSLIRIAELLARFKISTNILNSNAQLDINIIAEDILIPVLNIAYDCKLGNAKYIEDDSQFPAIDLLDRTNKIAFQITSSSDMKKVRKTIKGIIDNKFYNEFDVFYIYIITQKQSSYSRDILEEIAEGLFSFTAKNILDETDLYQKVASLSFDEIKEVEKLLEKQFSDIQKQELVIQNNLNGIIVKTKEDYQNQYLATELEGIQTVRQSWLRKKMFLESRLPSISDVNQQYSLYMEIKDINEKIEFYNNQISQLLP